MKRHDILYKYQFGFRVGMGTNTAVIILLDKIVSAPHVDNSDSVLSGVLLDFPRHLILLITPYYQKNYIN